MPISETEQQLPPSLVAGAAMNWVERGLVPDAAVRLGIRKLLAERLTEIHAADADTASVVLEKFVADVRTAPIAIVPEKANEQHYEIPAEFFGQVLGPHRKYSSAWWPAGTATLEAAEAAALQASCERAELNDGQEVMELGCGWGSLTLWMAQHYPASRFTGVSNSYSQAEYIMGEARRRNLDNVRIITCDMNRFDAEGAAARYDRIVSVEMFEHMRNWPQLFRKLRGWLKPGGRFFMHVFVHRATPYAFIERDASDWMSRYFFSGGMMPSDDMALYFQDDLKLLQRWRWDGTHYERTSNAWLANMDARRPAVWPVIEKTYGPDASLWWTRWRIFFMSCAELFGYNRGQEWWVSHYLFEPRS